MAGRKVPTAVQVRRSRDQLAAVIELDPTMEEPMTRGERTYLAGAVTALSWVVDGDREVFDTNTSHTDGAASDEPLTV